MKQQLYILLFILVSGFARAQSDQVRGRVIDVKTEKPLAFVNVVVNNSQRGTTTDIDGKFVIRSSGSIDELRMSYVGYETKTFQIPESYKGKELLLIKMNPINYQLDEFVVLPGKNPAHRIIKKAVENREINNPERSTSFSFESYNKLVFTADIDSAILNNPDTIPTLDSSDQRAIAFFDSSHIFMMESVTKRKHIPPDKSKETIIANRISGFENPTFSMIASEIQSFSFYDEFVVVGGNKYLNPISKGSVNKYYFQLEDTLYHNSDSVFVISYRPKKGKNFTGLEGVLSVSTDQYALKNVRAQPSDKSGISIKIQQQYEKIQGKQWFPVQLNTFIKFNNLATVNSMQVVGIGKSYIRNVDLDPEIDRREIKNVAIELDRKSNNRDEEFWNKYRQDSLTEKEKNTYAIIDSVGKAEDFETKLKALQALASGEWPVRFVNIDLDRIFGFTDYEGFRLGLGLHTNYLVSDVFRFGGYFAFGFKDKAIKYGGDASVIIDRASDLRFSMAYQKDVVETGGATFFGDNEGFLSESSYRDFFIQRMDSIEKFQSVISFRSLQHFKWYLFGNKQHRITTDEYVFQREGGANGAGNISQYRFTETGLGFRFAYKEKFYQTLDNRMISLGTKYPIFYGKITKGWKGLLGGEYDYWRYDLKVEKSFDIKNLGKSGFQLLTGLVDGNVPATMLHYGRGVFTQYSVAVQNGFETMRPNEFLSDKYASLFLRHSFKNLLVNSENFKPEFVLRTGIGFGTLSDVRTHRNIEYRTLEHGYYESGIEANNLLRSQITGLGIGAFYRYGPYSNENFMDNAAFKFTASFLF